MTMRRGLLLTVPGLLLAVAASCGGGDDGDGSGNESGALTGGAAGSANSGGTVAGGATTGGAGGAAGSSGGISVGECETIEGLDVAGECDTTAVEARIRHVNMLLVMDKSTSMEASFDAGGIGGAGGAGGAGGPAATRWETLKTALDAAMTSTQSGVDYGLLLYPSGSDCSVESNVQVPVGPGSTAVPSILGALETNPPDVAGTPMAAALDAALTYYTEGAGSALPGDKYVLLATDGGPNCNESLTCTAEACTLNLEGTCPEPNCCSVQPGACVDHAAVTARITALRAAGVDTFVVGIPGSEAYAAYLGEFADAGGRNPDGAPGTYYDVSGDEGAAGLTETFRRIALQLVTDCVIPVENVPALNEVNVAIDCVVMPQSGATSSWSFNDDFTQIIIEGERCEEIQSAGVHRLDVVFGCPIIR